jgi:hypothetical protein
LKDKTAAEKKSNQKIYKNCLLYTSHHKLHLQSNIIFSTKRGEIRGRNKKKTKKDDIKKNKTKVFYEANKTDATV